MLDENLPAFFLKASSSGVKHHESIFLSHHGSDPEPCYSLHHTDPASTSPAHKNCYASALFDAWNEEVLYGEVLARPKWTQPTLSQEEIRRNGGIPPPPQPVLPGEFVVQLYNPDQQVRVDLQPGKWGASDCWTFSLPETSFRTPSASHLDRGTSDPTTLDTTTKLNFVWRKESILSKDLTCYMTGRSTDKNDKKNKGRRDPDIAVALWRSMRELTVYEPNMQRLEIEDPKGLEIVLLLSAIVIKDLFFNSRDHLVEIFNISEGPGRKLSSGGKKLSNPAQVNSVAALSTSFATRPPGNAALGGGNPPRSSTPNDVKRNSLPKLQTNSPPPAKPSRQVPPPITDPRQQWQLDAETARLKALAEAERARAAKVRREQEKKDEAEAKRLKKQFDQEQKAEQRKQAEVNRETARLRQLYGVKPITQSQPQPQAQPNSSRPRPRPSNGTGSLQPIPQGRPAAAPLPSRLGSNGLYVQPSASASSVMMSGANNPSVPARPVTKKKSFFGLLSGNDEASESRLNKKRSSMW